MLAFTLHPGEAIGFSRVFVEVDGQLVRATDIIVRLAEIRSQNKARVFIEAPDPIDIDRYDSAGLKVGGRGAAAAGLKK